MLPTPFSFLFRKTRNTDLHRFVMSVCLDCDWNPWVALIFPAALAFRSLSHEVINFNGVTMSMIRKEEEGFGLTAAGFYSAFRKQTESRATSAHYNIMHRQYNLGLSRATRVPQSRRQPAVCPSLLASPFPVPFMRSLHATYWNKTGVCHLHLTHLLTARLPALCRCRPHWTTPPSPHTPTARLRPGSCPACSPPHFWRGSPPQPSAPPVCGPPGT